MVRPFSARVQPGREERDSTQAGRQESAGSILLQRREGEREEREGEREGERKEREGEREE